MGMLGAPQAIGYGGSRRRGVCCSWEAVRLGGEVMGVASLTHPTPLMDKSFLVLFCKKERACWLALGFLLLGNGVMIGGTEGWRDAGV